MKIKSLHFRNFKGIKKFDLPLNGESVSILGANGTGKTTIKDGVAYLLFDKGSDFKSLDPKTLDAGGCPVHGLEHEVSACFVLDSGQEVLLKKIYTEKWTKPRGQAKKIITGHTTEYYIDDMNLAIAKGKYQTAIKQVANEETFRLLTSPDYFPSVMKWEARRKLLMEVCGDVPDETVISSNEELQDLVAILSGRKLDDHKKVVAGQRKKINDQIEQIPARIDEVQRAMPDVTEINIEAERGHSGRLRVEIERIGTKITGVESGSVISGLKAEEEKARTTLSKATREFQAEIDQQITEATNYHAAVVGQVYNKKVEIHYVEVDTKDKQSEIERIESSIGNLEIEKDAELQREYDGLSHCPKCGFNLSTNQSIEDFNLDKSQSLERIQEEIDDQIAYKNILQRRISFNTGKAYTFNADLKKLNVKEAAALSALDALKEKRDGDFPGMAELQSKVDIIFNRIATANEAGPSEELAQLQTEKMRLEIIQEVTQELIKIVEDNKKSEARIQELKKEERMLAGKLEELERQLFLMDQFERAKVDMLEEKINSKFKHARFKLFHENIVNEGLRPMCEVTYQGVPYNSGLNNGHRIKVGLDIIRTLQEHFNFTAPCFIDNAESVHSLPEMDCQVVRLVVDETKPEMEVV